MPGERLLAFLCSRWGASLRHRAAPRGKGAQAHRRRPTPIALGAGRRGARRGSALLLIALWGMSGCAGVSDSSPEAAETAQGLPGATLADRRQGVKVRVIGVDEPVADNVRAHLSLASEACDAPRWRIDALAERAEDESRPALRALGYYRPEDIAVSVAETEGCWEAALTIAPGDALTLSEVDIRLEGTGSDSPEFRAHLDTLPLAAGDVVHHGAYEGVKRSIEDFARAHGFLDGAFVTTRLSVDVSAGHAAATLAYTPGPRYRFGTLHIEAPNIDETLIERLAAYPEGEPFDRDLLLAMNRRLSESGYFERVDLRPRLEQPVAGTVPVDLALAPRKKHAFTARMGVSTDVGPRVRVGYENRWRGEQGHRFSSSAATSFIRHSVDAEYRVPLERAATDWLGLRAGMAREDTETSDTREASFGIEWSVRHRDLWRETRFVSVMHDDFKVGRHPGTAFLVTPGVRYATVHSGDPFRPEKGYRLRFEIAGSHEALGSDVSFLRTYGSAGWTREVRGGGRILARSELGAVAGGTLEALPPSQRFFTGGDSTIRGYPFQSLGPVDENGEVVGGRYLATASLEYEHPLEESWSGAVFLDAGNAFAFEYYHDELAVGAGLGVRWRSPIGTVRLDVAHPFKRTRALRVHLRLGPEW